MVEKMFYCEAEEGNDIFCQGDTEGSSYFILNSGNVKIVINGDEKKTLSRGAAFGELALLYNTPRSATVRAMEKCGMWAIDRTTFRQCVEEIAKRKFEENKKFMENIQFYQNLQDEQKDAIASVMSLQKLSKGEYVVQEGDEASSFYVIKEGTVSILKGDKEIRRLSTGHSFGELALYYNTVRSCSVRVESDTALFLALGREIVKNILGNELQAITYKEQVRWVFENDMKLKSLPPLLFDQIIEKMVFESKNAGDMVCKKTDKFDRLVLVMDGSLKLGKNKIAEKGQTYSIEMYEKKKTKLSDNLSMNEDGQIAWILHDHLRNILGTDLEALERKRNESHEAKVTVLLQSEKKHPSVDIKLEDFIKIKKLGFGQFGSVYLVKTENDKKTYALKCISKNQVVQERLEKHLLQEKEVLEKIDFPFLMDFYRSYKDENNIYFLLEIIHGLELFDAIRDIGLLNTSEAMFYIGQIIFGIEYLHKKSIIYRDLKPENIMVGSDGYLKIIDMGTAKILNQKGGARTFTIIGTPHYMAPEVLTGKGYGMGVDYWSIGIILYEFLYGVFPFANDCDDPYEIYEEILRTPLKFPSFNKDKKVRLLITQLLNSTPEMRLGGSFTVLKSHTWFDKFDWDKLYSMKMKAPYKPPSNKVITEKEIEKLSKEKKLAIDEIKNEQKFKKNKKVLKPKDPNWDSSF